MTANSAVCQVNFVYLAPTHHKVLSRSFTYCVGPDHTSCGLFMCVHIPAVESSFPISKHCVTVARKKFLLTGRNFGTDPKLKVDGDLTAPVLLVSYDMCKLSEAFITNTATGVA